MTLRLVLASQSRARAALLTGAGVAFETASPAVDEAEIKDVLLAEGRGPKEIAVALAERKALSVQIPGALVIGADSTVDLGGRLFDKPPTIPAAADQLRALRGREHRLNSAAALARDGEIVWRHVDSAVLTVREFSEAFLQAYLTREGEAVLWSVGAYRLEGEGAQLFERIKGDYFTVLGLPLLALLEALRREGVLAA